MAKAKRNIGREILNGLREIKSGEYGRVVNVPDVSNIREKTDRTRIDDERFRRCRRGAGHLQRWAT
jgi:hypothetical protein